MSGSRRQILAALMAFALACGWGVRAAEVRPAPAYVPSGHRISPADGLAKQIKPVGATPRDAAGHPDLNGIWEGGDFDSGYKRFGPRRIDTSEPDQAVMQRGAGWNKPIYKPQFWEKVSGLDYGRAGDDPVFHCSPPGTPRANIPNQIVATATTVVTFNHGYVDSWRIIPVDGRKRDPDDSDYSLYVGRPLGHWEGDTLVVHSTGFNDLSWLMWTGYFHSNRMELTERFRRQGDVLFYSFTVNDPEVLVRPWTSDTYARRLAKDPLARVDIGQPCVEMDVKEMADPFFRG